MGTLTYTAEMPLPVLLPSVELSIGAPAIAISAELSGALSLNASLSVGLPIAFYLAALAEMQVQIDASIAFGFPSVDVNLALNAQLALVAQLEAAVGLLVTLEGLLSASIGLYAYTYSGTASAMGAALTSDLASTWPDGAPTSAACQAIVLGATTPIAQTQLLSIFNGLQRGSGLLFVAKMSALAQLSVVTDLAIGQGYSAIQLQLKTALQLLAAMQVSFTPPTLAVTAEALATFSAYLSAHASLGPPSLQAAISATANLAASLQAQFGLIIDLGLAINRYDAQLFVYSYSGTGAAMGSAVTSALASTWGDGTTPTSGACVAAILATTDSASWTVLTGFMGGAL